MFYTDHQLFATCFNQVLWRLELILKVILSKNNSGYWKKWQQRQRGSRRTGPDTARLLKPNLGRVYTSDKYVHIVTIADNFNLRKTENLLMKYFVLMLPMKWEQPSTVKSVFQLIIKQSQSELFSETERWGKRAR